MSTSLESAVESYLRARSLSRGTRNEYASTLRKWKLWGQSIPIEDLSRKNIREFLDRVREEAIAEKGTNPGRAANKARENLRAVMSWAWEQDLLETLPRCPPAKDQNDVEGHYYLSKAELNASYSTSDQLRKPRGWSQSPSIGAYSRSGLELFFNSGVETGTIWKPTPIHEPILWRHISGDLCATDVRRKDRSQGESIYSRRVTTPR